MNDYMSTVFVKILFD